MIRPPDSIVTFGNAAVVGLISPDLIASIRSLVLRAKFTAVHALPFASAWGLSTVFDFNPICGAPSASYFGARKRDYGVPRGRTEYRRCLSWRLTQASSAHAALATRASDGL